MLFVSTKTDEVSPLKKVRLKVGISQRELARLIDETQSTVEYWEKPGNLPRASSLIPIAKALGVTIEEILGQAPPKSKIPRGGKMLQLFTEASTLPRSQQKKISDVVEALIAQAKFTDRKAS